ncbi:hypothetical protein CPC_A0309 [Clostridium perfringens C str. JGS1495]|nr:hypothetical protein CPC_A0309 [Clostridium perfringens C str. JGS1495]
MLSASVTARVVLAIAFIIIEYRALRSTIVRSLSFSPITVSIYK